jgi:hypothetical protein
MKLRGSDYLAFQELQERGLPLEIIAHMVGEPVGQIEERLEAARLSRKQLGMILSHSAGLGRR